MTPQMLKLRSGRYLVPVETFESHGYLFLNFPFNRKLMDEVRVMEGARYHGFDGAPDRKLVKSVFKKDKVWSVALTPRNRFQLEYLTGGNPYKRWDQELDDDSRIKFDRPLYGHQAEMTSFALLLHYIIFGAEMGTGKTLAAIEIMERSLSKDWFYVGPRSALKAVERELNFWRFKGDVNLMTYDGLKKRMKNWQDGAPAPFGCVLDESSLCKTPASQRSQAAQALADGIRQDHSEDPERWWEPGLADPFVVLLTGTPAPKGPIDWWKQCEIAAPGFLREGHPVKFKLRLGLFESQESDAGYAYQKRVTWFDNEKKCAKCGKFADDIAHANIDPDLNSHEFEQSVNEVERLYGRMKGLVHVYFKKDCLDLPEKVYNVVTVKPTPSTVRAAKLIAKKTGRAAQVLILLRELSDGFQYVEQADGEKPCPGCGGEGTIKDYVMKPEYDTVYQDTGELPDDSGINADEYREKYFDYSPVTCPTCGGNKVVAKTKRVMEQISCPKDDVFKDALERHIEDGRLVAYGGFQGTVDRMVAIAQSQDWTVIKWDGRGTKILGPKGQTILGDPLTVFQDGHEDYPRVCFIGQGDSAGMGLTLTASNEIFVYSNTFSAQSRIQLEDRIHRPGTRGALITDVVHLPTDQLILDNLKEKRDVQAISMGDLSSILDQANSDERLF